MASSENSRPKGANTSASGDVGATFVPTASSAKTRGAALDGTVVPDKTVVPGTDLEATNVPTASVARSQAGRSSTSVPASSKAPAQGAPIGPQGRGELGDFRLIRKLGQGGMGEVFLAHQISLDRQAALKVLSKALADKPDFVKRFYREARAMAKVDHPHAVRVFAVDEDDGVHYVAMELIDGQSMQKWLDQLGKLSVGDAIHVTLRCAEALEQAHQINLVHRDIKPDNMMVTKRGVVKLADFGLAKALDDEEMSMTQSGTGLGTPYYMAPEQARNAKYVDGRSDTYALGITLYHFLTGKLPFSGNSAMEIVLAKEQGRFTSARKLNPEVPERLDLIIDKMIAKDPQQRFKDCGELITFLSGLGLENRTLSFIEGAAVASSPRMSAPATSRAPAQATSVGSKLAATRVASDSPPRDQTWMVEFRDSQNNKTVSRWTTQQVLQNLRSGTIDNRAKVKKNAADSFIPISQFPEFAQTVQGLLLKKEAERKGTRTKQFLLNYRWHEFLWKLRTVVFKMFSSVMGLVTFVLYLAIVAGIGYGAYWGWMNYGRQELQKAMQRTGGSPQTTQPATTGQSPQPIAPTATPASNDANPGTSQ